ARYQPASPSSCGCTRERPVNTPPYLELQAATNFSFLRGASHPEELFATAKFHGYAALGIADFDTVAGIVRAHVAAEATGVRLIAGCRLSLTDGSIVLAYPLRSCQSSPGSRSRGL
ncbi:PHP domain-containing protein, partial [Kozakia baliensis]|uniref:PHP domain-containing protein n=2 Tax=Kozakia baliensis TaxID=153496 RepID=UPI0027957B9E